MAQIDPTSAAALATELAAIPERAAGTDAERRAGKRLEQELRAIGRTARTDTSWVRPNLPAAYAAAAATGLAGSVVSVDHSRTGLWLALAALVLLLLDLLGVGILRRLTRERATPCVVSPARAARKVTLLVTARIDAPRRGALAWIPMPLRLLVVGLVGICVLAALRVSDVDGDWLGPVQLVPTVMLILAVGAFLDAATAPADGSPGAATGPAAALQLVRALDAVPPRRLAVEVVLCGAGGIGFAAHVRRLRRAGVRPEEICVLHLDGCGSAPLRYWRREGPLVPLAFHSRLVQLAGEVAADERHLGAGPAGSATASPAYAARARRWPAIRIGSAKPSGAADPDAIGRTVAFAQALVARLDADLAAADGRPEKPERTAAVPLLRR